MVRRAFVVTILLTLCSACQGDDAELTPVVCDPLKVESSRELSLATFVGAGSDVDGTLYVLDEVGGELRAFISEAGELYRQRVSGSGRENGEDGRVDVVSLLEREEPLTLQVATAVDGTQRVGIFRGELATKTFIIGEQGEELAPLDTEAVNGLVVHDYPAEVVVEYAATLSDERRLVVIRPRDLLAYEEFRVFFGPTEHLAERKLIDISRARDGGSTSIVFDVDGQQAHVSFPVEFVDDVFTAGAPALTIGDADLELTLQLPAQSPQGSRYYCRD